MTCKCLTILLLISLLTGCVSINADNLLKFGTKIEIIDETKSTFSDPYLKNNLNMELIRQKLVQVTKEELNKRSIETLLAPSSKTAKLKYNIIYIKNKKGEFEIGYNVSLESPDGKTLFDDKDEKDGDDIDHALDKIARRVSNSVESSFNPASKTSKSKSRFVSKPQTPQATP